MRAPTSVPVALGLGANLGDPEGQLRAAIDSLSTILGPLRVADLYRSRAHGIEDQPDYLNTAAAGQTTLPPDAVLAVAKRLEHAAGRRPGERFGPRPLDIDILLYGDRELSRPGLVLPHPRLLQRRFALAPLADVAADWQIPGSGLTVAQALERVGQEQGVLRVGWTG